MLVHVGVGHTGVKIATTDVASPDCTGFLHRVAAVCVSLQLHFHAELVKLTPRVQQVGRKEFTLKPKPSDPFVMAS